MAALLRILFAFASRFVPFLSVAGSAMSVAFSVASAFVSSSFSRLWVWGLMAVSFLLRYLPVLMFFSAVVLISNLLLSLVAFVLYHVNVMLTLGLSPFVTVSTVRIVDNAVLGVLAFFLVRFALFLASWVSSSIPLPQSAPSWPIWISALKK